MTRDVTDDSVNPDKTALVLADKVLLIDTETNPDSLKEALISDLLKTINLLNIATVPDIANDYLLGYDASEAQARRFLPSALFATVLTWTPTWTNLVVGAGTLTTKYLQIGKLVAFHLALVFAADTVISGNVLFTVPVTPIDYGKNMPVGVARYKDATGGNAAQGVSQIQASSSNCAPNVYDTSGTYATATQVNATIPFTWAVNDDLECSGVYLAA